MNKKMVMEEVYRVVRPWVTFRDIKELAEVDFPDYAHISIEDVKHEFLDIYDTALIVEIQRPETDEEYNNRMEERRRIEETYEKVTKKTRYQEYLKLHEEFKDYEVDTTE